MKDMVKAVVLAFVSVNLVVVWIFLMIVYILPLFNIPVCMEVAP